jgi:hypothetical protein
VTLISILRVRRPERGVHVIAEAGRSVVRLRGVDDLLGRHPAAHQLADGLIEPRMTAGVVVHQRIADTTGAASMRLVTIQHDVRFIFISRAILQFNWTGFP